MQEFVAALIAFFLIEPLQTEMEKRIGSASRENMAEVSACIRAATPVLVRQATDEPWRTVTHIVGIWSGAKAPEDILVETTPSCARAVELVRPPAASRI
jgi:hypothetical protein